MDSLAKQSIRLQALPGITAPRVLPIRNSGRNGGSPAAGSSRFSLASDNDSGYDEDEADEVGQGDLAGDERIGVGFAPAPPPRGVPRPPQT